MMNPEVQTLFKTRARTISYIRSFLDNLWFLEVETHAVNLTAGGAIARPFVTHHNELDTKLFMSVSLELYLKKLVVGGFDHVYDTGKQFMNEGMDLTHSPEFTMCDFYMAHADYNDLMDLAEQLLSGMEICKDSNKGMEIEYIDISPLPFLNTDLEVKGTYPPVVEAFRKKIEEADCFLFTSPEYNYSVTGKELEGGKDKKICYSVLIVIVDGDHYSSMLGAKCALQQNSKHSLLSHVLWWAIM